jgi:hypothetical protein
MLLYSIVWVSLIVSYLTDVRRTRVIGSADAVASTGTARATGTPIPEFTVETPVTEV